MRQRWGVRRSDASNLLEQWDVLHSAHLRQGVRLHGPRRMRRFDLLSGLSCPVKGKTNGSISRSVDRAQSKPASGASVSSSSWCADFRCGSSGDAPPAVDHLDASEAAPPFAEADVPEGGDADATETASATTTPICSPDGWCWEEPKPQGNDLFGVWGASASQVFAVGELGTVLQFDGTRWSLAPWSAREHFRAVWGSAPDDVWGVGDAATVAHFDGTSWTARDMGAVGVDAGVKPKILAVTGSSRSNVWAVGEGGIVLHFDGTNWAPATTGTTATLRAVFATETEVFAAGDNGTIAHYVGNAWMLDTKSFPMLSIVAMGGTSGNDVWATCTNGAVLHFDGTAWTSAPLDTTPLRTVLVENADSVWAAGDNGSVWHYAQVPIEEGGVAEAGPIDATAARVDAAKKDAATSDGAHKWSKIATGTRASFYAAWTSGHGDVWMVGGAGETRRWNGSGWDRLGTASSKNRLAISGSSANDIWITGDETLHYDGAGWKLVATGTDRSLYGLASSDPGAGWAVGTGGTIVHLGGAQDAGAPQDSPTTQWLRAVWTSGISAGWIVGGAGTTLGASQRLGLATGAHRGASPSICSMYGGAL